VVFSTNKTDRHNITKILLKVALNTINQTNDVFVIVVDICQHSNFSSFSVLKSISYMYTLINIRMLVSLPPFFSPLKPDAIFKT
jgi:hypothetical protein